MKRRPYLDKAMKLPNVRVALRGTPPLVKTLERDVEKAIRDLFATSSKWLCVPIQADWGAGRPTSRTADEGSSDLVIMRSGIFAFVECKRPGEDLRKSQLEFARDVCLPRGLLVIVTDEVEELRNLMRLSGWTL